MHFQKERHPFLHCSYGSSLPYFPLASPLYALGLPQCVLPGVFWGRRGEGKGKWKDDEQRVYIRFLQQNSQDMSCSLSRKANKVFLKMSRIIKTRTPDQCRSHHQKILKYHSSVQDIILRYKRRFGGEPASGNHKNLKETAAEVQEGQDYYQLKRVGNQISINIQQSAIQTYHL